MSFLSDLARRNRKQEVVQSQVQPIPISLSDAHGGLAAEYREPYRVNGPISSQTTPATQSRMQMIPPPINYRG